MELDSLCHRAFYPELEFPFICPELPECAPESFATWPQDHGWRWTHGLRITDFAKRVQAWLFFGLLSAWASKLTSRHHFLITNKTGSFIISFDNVDAFLRSNACDRLVSAQLEPRRLELLKFAKSFMARTVMDYLMSIDNDSSTTLWTSKEHAAIFAADVLIDKMYHVNGTTNPATGIRWSLAAQVRVIRESARIVWRCPSLGWRLFPSSLAWYELLVNHRAYHSMFDHTGCLATKCLQNEIDVGSYKTSHVSTCTGCSWMRSNQEVVTSAIAEDKIPLICCYTDSRGRIKMDTVKDDLRRDYCAISHVWSGGLGNLEDNAIPYCQLLFLKTAIDSIPPPPVHTFDYPGASWLVERFVKPVQAAQQSLWPSGRTYFWLDTLCIPVTHDQQQLRRQAIDSMGQIYAGATKTLVLDPDLQHTSTRVAFGGDVTAMHLCISASSWMSRSWPLQEGVIPLNLFVKFKDCCVLLDGKQKNDVGLPNLTMGDIDPADDYERLIRSKARQFDATWNSLVTRKTKKRDDLHSILAGLCNLSASEVLQLPSHQRLKAIIKSQPTIPIVLLYEHRESSANMGGNKCSWNPQLPGAHEASGFMSRDYGTLEFTDTGFKVVSFASTCPIIVHAGLPPADRFLLLPEGSRHKFSIHLTKGLREVKGKARVMPQVVFLSRRRLFNKADFQGALFLVQEMGRDKLSITFDCSLTWTETNAALIDYTDGIETIRCQYLEREDGTIQDVYIQEDVQSWPQLKWTRPTAFPFSSISTKYLVSLSGSVLLSVFLVWSATIFLHIGRHRMYRLDLPIDFKGTFLYLSIMIVRILFLLIEMVFWLAWLTNFAQKRWAASFHQNELARRILRSRDPPIWFTLPSHLPCLVFSFLLFLLGRLLPQQNSLWIFSLTLFLEPLARVLIEAVIRWQYLNVIDFFENARLSISSAILLTVGIGIGWYGALTRSAWTVWAINIASIVLLTGIASMLYATKQGRTEHIDNSWYCLSTGVLQHTQGSLSIGAEHGYGNGFDVSVVYGNCRIVFESGSFYSVAFSPDGTKIASDSQDGSVRIWDVATGNQLLKLDGHRKQVNSVTFSPDGTTIGSGLEDGSVRMWNATVGNELLKLDGYRYGVDSVAFSPDGTTYAFGSANGSVTIAATSHRHDRCWKAHSLPA